MSTNKYRQKSAIRYQLIMHRLHPSQSARKQKVAAGGGGGDRGRTRGRDECQWQWQTDKQFVFEIPLLPIRSPMGGLPRISVGVGTKSGSEAAAVKVGIGERVRRVGG